MGKQVEQALKVIEQAGLKLGVNWQKELATLINDIAKRDEVTPEQVILSPEILSLLNEPKLNAPQKLAKLKEVLLTKRYPMYSKAKLAFQQQIKALGLGPKIKIKPPPFFEDNKITVEFTYQTPEELEGLLAALSRLKGVNLVKNALKAAEDNS